MSETNYKIPPKFLKFFIQSGKERWVLCQGSRRSGKSWSCILWMRLLGKVIQRPYTILMVDATYPALQLLMQDFESATGLVIQGSQKLGYYAIDDNILWQFKHFPTRQKAQGTQADILYLNEGLNIPYDVISTLSMGIRDQIITSFNPTVRGADLLKHKNDNNFMISTWKDNPYLTDEQKGEFEEIKNKALAPGASPYQIYCYETYYLGQASTQGGKVFNKVYTITDDEYFSLPLLEVYGLDFGLADGGDATAMAGCKIDRQNNIIYFKQYIYDKFLTNNKDLAQKMLECGLDKRSFIVGDYGGMGKHRMTDITTGGNGTWEPELCQFNIQNAIKPKLDERIISLLSYDRIYVTESSTEMHNEFIEYELDPKTNKPKGGNDHLIDAGSYAMKTLQLTQ